MARIADEVVDEGREAPHVARRFLRARHVAERSARRGFGVGARHSGGDERVRLLFDVRPDLVGDVVETRATKPCKWVFHASSPSHYSARRACTGSTRLARRAGSHEATSATTTRSAATAANVGASYTLISYIQARSTRTTATDSTLPSA